MNSFDMDVLALRKCSLSMSCFDRLQHRRKSRKAGLRLSFDRHHRKNFILGVWLAQTNVLRLRKEGQQQWTWRNAEQGQNVIRRQSVPFELFLCGTEERSKMRY